MYVYLQGGVKGSIFELSAPFYKDNNKEQQLQVHEQQMKPLHSQAYRQCQRVHEATSLFAPAPLTNATHCLHKIAIYNYEKNSSEENDDRGPRLSGEIFA